MTNRTITGNIYEFGGGSTDGDIVTIYQREPFIDNGVVYQSGPTTAIADANGDWSKSVPVPSSGSVSHRIAFPSGDLYDYYVGLGDGSSVNVTTLITATGSPATGDVYEPALGNPASNGYVLSSTTAGVRSWVAQSGGAVDSVFGRTGAVVAASGDYNTDLIADNSEYAADDLTTALNTIGLEITTMDSSKQNASVKLTALDALTWAANSIIQLTSTSAAAVVTLASHVWTFLQSADAAAARSAIGAGTGDGDLLAANNLSDVTASTARTNLGLVAGGTGDIWIEKAGDTMSGALLMGTNYIQAQSFRPVSTAFYFESSAGPTSFFAILDEGQHRFYYNNRSAAASANMLTFKVRATGAAQNGFGGSVVWDLETTTTNDITAGRMAVLWNTATHASRVPDGVFYLTDSAAEREIWRGRANGSAAQIGFLGATPVARQAHIADASGDDAATVNAILDVLEAFGLVATS